MKKPSKISSTAIVASLILFIFCAGWQCSIGTLGGANVTTEKGTDKIIDTDNLTDNVRIYLTDALAESTEFTSINVHVVGIKIHRSDSDNSVEGNTVSSNTNGSSDVLKKDEEQDVNGTDDEGDENDNDEQDEDEDEIGDDDQEDDDSNLSGWVDVPLKDGPKTYNLLELSNDATAILGDVTLPEGMYQQLRLSIDSSTVTTIEGEFDVEIPGRSKSGLKINLNNARIEKDKKYAILLDFDAIKSIHKRSANSDDNGEDEDEEEDEDDATSGSSETNGSSSGSENSGRRARSNKAVDNGNSGKGKAPYIMRPVIKATISEI